MTNNDLVQIVGLIIQFAGFVTVIIIFIAQNKINKNLSKREIYQRLELASVDLFRFELENSENSWRLYDENYQIPHKTTREHHDLENHFTQIVNLFEMIVEFRNEKIVDNKIFATWLAWFWEMIQIKNFVEIWKEMKFHYTAELRFIIETGIISDGDWNMYILKLCKKYKGTDIADLLTEEIVEKKPVGSVEGLAFSWGCQADLPMVDELVDIFVRNVDTNYISHGEVIDGRANNLNEWKTNLSEIMKKEFMIALNCETKENDCKQLSICKLNNQLIGVALVEFIYSTNVSILSDVIIDQNFRDRNIGHYFISWIEKDIKANNIGTIFLESGIKNNLAHKFFERSGYKKSSVVMVKKI